MYVYTHSSGVWIGTCSSILGEVRTCLILSTVRRILLFLCNLKNPDAFAALEFLGSKIFRLVLFAGIDSATFAFFALALGVVKMH